MGFTINEAVGDGENDEERRILERERQQRDLVSLLASLIPTCVIHYVSV